jgi:hypothetical protein
MTNIDTTAPGDGGSLVLRGHTIAIDSDIAHAFATDAVRFIEGLLTEEQLRKKYQLDDAGWKGLADNEPLQLLVGRLKEERVREGTAGREKAAHRWISAIDVVDAIVQDPTASAKHRLDGARELRQAATNSDANTPANDRDRISIRINFGPVKLHREMDLKPVKPEHDEEDKPMKLIEPKRDEEDDDYERREWCGDG